MFAVMKTGGKQYRVAPGDVLRVEKLAADAGERVQFNEVLMVGDESVTVGNPTVAGAAVQADVIDQIRGEKVIHFVKRRRKHSSKRTKGHRQSLTLLRVADILLFGAESSGVKAAVGGGFVRAVGENTRTPVAAEGTPSAKPEDELAGRKPTNLLDAARDGRADDLKKIAGVGPKLEGLLHANGVFHFDQIAAWGLEEIAFMDDRLSFKGRIARDRWIDQAKTFAAEQE